MYPGRNEQIILDRGPDLVNVLKGQLDAFQNEGFKTIDGVISMPVGIILFGGYGQLTLLIEERFREPVMARIKMVGDDWE